MRNPVLTRSGKVIDAKYVKFKATLSPITGLFPISSVPLSTRN